MDFDTIANFICLIRFEYVQKFLKEFIFRFINGLLRAKNFVPAFS